MSTGEIARKDQVASLLSYFTVELHNNKPNKLTSCKNCTEDKDAQHKTLHSAYLSDFTNVAASSDKTSALYRRRVIGRLYNWAQPIRLLI